MCEIIIKAKTQNYNVEYCNTILCKHKGKLTRVVRLIKSNIKLSSEKNGN